MGQTEGATNKTAAKKLGIPLEEYIGHKDQGEKWCWRCQDWRKIKEFGPDKGRGDGLRGRCRKCSQEMDRKRTNPSGRSANEARKGNKNRLGKPFTPEQLAYMRKRVIETTPRGPEHPNWKGGTRSERVRLRRTPEYVDWRKAVFERDSYTCQMCGDKKGGNLRAHHVLPWATYKEHRFDVDNGLTLCEPCHEKIHYKPDSYRNRAKRKRQGKGDNHARRNKNSMVLANI